MVRLAATAGLRGRREPAPAPPVPAGAAQWRRNRVLDALTAASVPANRGMLATYDLAFGSLGGKVFADAVLEAGYTEATGGAWPSDAAALADVGGTLFHDGHAGEGVYLLPGSALAHVRLGDTFVHVHVVAASRDRAAAAVAAFQATYPPLYLDREGEDGVVVPMTFWMLSRFGPERRLRRIDATDWASVEANYPGDVRAEVARLASPGFRPGDGGQLILWHGPPGTGKTWALRALASEWSAWAEFHYITDPDAFFVQDASYMVDVLLADSYEQIDEPTGDLVTAEEPGGKWRVLILEDTGELLSADAKEKSGQGLSRLLNVVDGMIGQGLRVLVVVTTNDEITDLHPAVKRPGRCASQLVFGPLSAEEASVWLGEETDGGTLAELYARLDGEVPARDPSFTAEPEDGRDLMAGGDRSRVPVPGAPGWEADMRGVDRLVELLAADDEATLAAVLEVAERHVPESSTYGDTWWRQDDRTVFWNAADWTTQEELDAARDDFLAIDGVKRFDSDAEVGHPDDSDAWRLVWPPTGGDGEDALEEALRLARLPLEHLEPAALPLPPDVSEAIAELPAAARTELAAALEQFGRVHASTTEAMTAAVVSAFRGRQTDQQAAQGNELAAAAIAALGQLAARPAPPAAPIHVHVPQQDVSVHVDGPTIEAPRVDVHVPQQPQQLAPVVHVAAAEAPVVNVTVPEQAPVVVNVEPTPVTVNVEQPPRPRAVRVTEDDEGNRVFETLDDE